VTLLLVRRDGDINAPTSFTGLVPKEEENAGRELEAWGIGASPVVSSLLIPRGVLREEGGGEKRAGRQGKKKGVLKGSRSNLGGYKTSSKKGVYQSRGSNYLLLRR